MAKSEFCEINIDNFFNMKGEMPFDVYVRLSDSKFTKIFKRGDTIDRSRFEVYAAKGVNELYVHRSERREYIAATERLVQRILQKGELSGSEAKKAVVELTEQTLFEVFDDHVFDEETVRRAQTTVRVYVELVSSDVRTLASFINLAKNQSYLCRHSIATAIFGVLLARGDSNVNDKTLTIVGLGGLLHDIGMSELPNEINEVDRRLSPEEWAKVKQHPALGIRMIEKSTNCPNEIRIVLEQHHEYWNGRGYPRGIKGEEIFYPARVVSIVDSFSALTTRRGGRALYSPEDAIALMSTEEGKYDQKLLRKFAGLLNLKKKAA